MRKEILVLVPKGSGGPDELRARRLTAFLDANITFHIVDRKLSYRQSISQLWSIISSKPWSLVYQEGTGIIGGLNLIRSARKTGQKYVLSSGDPIAGFFHATKGALVGNTFGIYEKVLYKHCAGFIGWTPYLTGVAMNMGARRAATIEGAVLTEQFKTATVQERKSARLRFGLSDEHIVLGNIGTLVWNPRARYCYSLEMVELMKYLKRTDVALLIVGDGTGRKELERRVSDQLRDRVIFTGRLSESDVIESLAAMDIGFITQTLDQLGSYRLTTKLPEYLSCGIPVAMSPIPGFYDYVSSAGWALPQVGLHPSDAIFHRKCAHWIDGLTRSEISQKGSLAREIAVSRFDYSVVGPRFREFVESIW